MSDFNPELPEFPFDGQQPGTKDNNYSIALAKIEQLECELQKKEKTLAVNLKEQGMLSETLRSCIKIFQTVTGQINKMESDLQNIAHHYRQSVDHVEALVQENKRLVGSNAAWSSRSIKLEFDILKANEEIKAIKEDHDLAFGMIDLLLELKATKTETDNFQRKNSNGDDQPVK